MNLSRVCYPGRWRRLTLAAAVETKVTRDELRIELLTESGISLFRQTVVQHYSWLMHEAPFASVNEIREHGIQPRIPYYEIPQIVTNAFGNVDGIVCLNPVGSRPAGSSSTENTFRLGLRAADLPERLGLDWSYPESWALRNITEAQIEDWGKSGAILYVVDDTGSIVSYSSVDPSLLRVCTHGKHGKFPSTWPMLTDVNNNQIATYSRSV